MIDKIVVHDGKGIRKVAGFKNGVLKEFVVHDKSKANEGNIYLGKITKKIKTANNKEGFFVNIGSEREAFINAEEKDLEDLVAHEGQDIVVQVTQEQRAEKGVRVARFLHFVGVNLVFCPYGGEINISNKIINEEKRVQIYNLVAENSKEGGWIIRTHAEEAKKEDIIEEMNDLYLLFKDVVKKAKECKAPNLLFEKDNILQEMIIRNLPYLQRVYVDNHLLKDDIGFDVGVEYVKDAFKKEGIDEFLAEALQEVICLKCGGRVIIEETKAFVAIDVDSGKGFTQGSFSRLNIEAAKEIAHQIILRNLSGKIIIDFAGISDFKFLKDAINVLERELDEDYAKARVLGLSRAGNVEILRMRKYPSLRDLLTEECASCQGTGRVEK